MGAIQENRKNFAEAVGYYRKALELDGSSMMALNNLAYILLEYADQPDEGLIFAEKAREVAPDSPVVQDTLGWGYYRKGRYADAVKYLERAASKQPDSTTKLHLGSVYVKLGDPPVQVFFGDVPAQVLYSGLAGTGLWQINAMVPNGLSGRTPVFLVSGGLASNAVTITVQ
jgi:tetratricopeptide (TPR) repeat protein